MAHAETGRDALALAGRFIQTQTQLVRVTTTPRGKSETTIAITNLQGGKRELIQLSERQVSFLHKLLGDIFGPRYAPAAILFDHDRQAEESRYIAALGRVPEFNAGANGVVMRNDMLAEPIPRAHPQIRAMAADYLTAMAARGEDTLVDQVSDVVRALLASSDCEASDAARVLGLEVRTMQRRLFSAGSSFERIKDQVRRDLAEQWLAEPDIPLIQISTMLQYANASAFTRSCRRWFGASPSEHRARLAASNAA
jgi:AraC-like DNA-binding protein